MASLKHYTKLSLTQESFSSRGGMGSALHNAPRQSICHSRRARAYPAHKALYTRARHIYLHRYMYQSSYTELKKTRPSQSLGRGGEPTPSFPLPNAPPKHSRGQMCILPKREHSFTVPSAVLPTPHGLRAHAGNLVWGSRVGARASPKDHSKIDEQTT